MIEKVTRVNAYLNEGRPWAYTIFLLLIIGFGSVVDLISHGRIENYVNYSVQWMLIFFVWLTYYFTKKGMKVVYQWLISWVLLTTIWTLLSLYDKSIVDYTGVLITAIIALLTSIFPFGMAKSYYKQQAKEASNKDSSSTD